jgi:hypothetical protein
MSKFTLIPLLIAGAFGLAGCADGVTPYVFSPNTVIATSTDTGHDKGPLLEGDAAVAYDGDGCQVWIIDDGIEGYAGRRFDPVTGLPICNNLYPPGTVVGDYQSRTPGMPDYTPTN